MHMADALLSPEVGCAMWVASAGAVAYCSKKVSNRPDEKTAPLMGVMGAFVFAAQMISFAIPATGSSGHLGGGLLLAVLLGPHAAFLTLASVLTVQALFFADGGLLALGANIFNLGFFPAFAAYPLVYKKISSARPGRSGIAAASIFGAITALQLGSLGVVLETAASGISSLPFSTFAALMQPIHLCIGIAEGLATAAVISFIHQARPEILRNASAPVSSRSYPVRAVAVTFLALAIVTGGIFSQFASKNPDGLEWSLKKAIGTELPAKQTTTVHSASAGLQKMFSILPDYNFANPEQSAAMPGSSLSGVLGSLITLMLAGIIGFILKKRVRPA